MAPATLASYDPVPDRPFDPPMDRAVRVGGHVDYLLVAGQLGSLTPSAWVRSVGEDPSVTALWPDDRAWCLYGDPDLDVTVLGGTAQLCARALAVAGLGAVPWPD